MTKSIYYICIAFCIAVMTSCISKQDEIKKGIEQFNSGCPITINEYIKIVSAEYADDEVVFEYEIDDSEIDFKKGMDFDGNAKEIIASSFDLNNNDVRTLFSTVYEAGAKISFKYNFATSRSSRTITLTNEEIKQILNGETERLSDEELLRKQVESANKMCPMFVDDITRLDKCLLTGSSVVYEYTLINEDPIDLTDTELQQTLKENIESGLKETSDPTLKKLIELCCSTNCNIIYRYKDEKSGTSMEITFNPEELK